MRRSLRWLAILFVAGNLSPTTFFAQAPPVDPTIQSLRSDMDELIKGQIELQKQIQDLKTVLLGNQACAQAPKQNIVFAIAAAPVLGNAKAPVTVIEFSDFQCPFSGKYNQEIFPRLDQNYIKTGKIKYVFRDFPLENMHPLARRLAEAGQCALTQKKFWELRTLFFNVQSSITAENMIDLARQAPVNPGEFEKCLHDARPAAVVSQELSEATAVGVTGTPTFFFGRTDPGSDKVKVGKVMVGAQPYESFQQTIDSLLADKTLQKL